nr:cupredoxin domain-containing protein [Actinomycetota bacterium]
MKQKLLAASVSIIFALSACGDAPRGESPATPADGGMGDHGGMGSADTSAFGMSAEVDEADRTIRVSMVDTFYYQPAEVSVEMGETIAFEVTNEGEAPHEFVLGDGAFQEEHETGMTEMDGELPPDESFALSVQPSGTETLAWTFSKAGTFEYACHVSGHYDAGMFGRIAVQE